jgi:hypothetical protein
MFSNFVIYNGYFLGFILFLITCFWGIYWELCRRRFWRFWGRFFPWLLEEVGLNVEIRAGEMDPLARARAPAPVNPAPSLAPTPPPANPAPAPAPAPAPTPGNPAPANPAAAPAPENPAAMAVEDIEHGSCGTSST